MGLIKKAVFDLIFDTKPVGAYFIGDHQEKYLIGD